MKLIMEGWRDFLKKSRRDSENKDKEDRPPPSSLVTALMKRGGLSRDEAEKQAKSQIDLEEAEELDEVEAMDAITTSQDEVQQSLDYFYNEHAPSKGERQDLGSALGHDLVRFDMIESDDLLFFLAKDESPRAYVAVGPFEDGYAVGNVRKTKGGGFYITDFYKELMDRLRGPLYSDSKQTAAGAAIWTRLQQDPDVNVEKVGSEDEWRWKAAK